MQKLLNDNGFEDILVTEDRTLLGPDDKVKKAEKLIRRAI